MQPQILVVADPPHGEVDYEATAATLGLAISDTRMKMGFAAPEILAASSQIRAGEIAESLADAGLRVAVVDGRKLAELPWPSLASSFGFDADGATAIVDGERIEVPYDVPVVAVSCVPPREFVPPGAAVERKHAGPEGLAVAERIEWTPHVDLYFRDSGAVRRVTVAAEATDVAGRGSDADAVAAAVDEIEGRFTCLDLDRRLERVRPRQRFVMGETGFDIDLRKLYSFGTLLLRQALDSISPELRDLTQYEFGSRLSYVLKREAV